MAMNTRAVKLTEAPAETRIRTLIVDDSPFMLKLLARTIEKAGRFELIGSATDGCQAVRYVSALSPDLVLMDLHLPHLNGIQATQLIKEREHPPVVIIITSNHSCIARSMAEEAGADDFLVKSATLNVRLTRTLQDLFGASDASPLPDGGVRNPAHGLSK